MWASVAKIRAFAKLMKIEINIISSAFVRLMVQVAEALFFTANMFVLESALSKETIHICIRTKQRTRLCIARYHIILRLVPHRYEAKCSAGSDEHD